MQNSFLLYGANGYTGNLITRFSKEYNLSPILAGRNADVIKPLADKYQLPFRIFDVNDSQKLKAALMEVNLVVNAAGPFQFTARQMIDGCLQTNTHYIDINGDIAVFEMIRQFSDQAKQKAVMLLPGAGFDVVPTDCLALYLKNKLPDATDLKLAFAALGGGLSHGTATTMVNKLGEGGAVRKNGKIVNSPLGEKGIWLTVDGKKMFFMTIPWGDVSTAYFTTGIPNIESYTAMNPRVYQLLKLQSAFNWLLRTKIARKYLKRKIEKRPAGPVDEQRKKAKSFIWGQVTNAAGKKIDAEIYSPDGYTLTALSCLIIAKKILQGQFKTGYQTPASAYGEDLVLEIPGTQRQISAQ